MMPPVSFPPPLTFLQTTPFFAWSYAQLLTFTISTLCFLKLLDIFAALLSHAFPRNLPPRAALRPLELLDRFYIAFNKLFTVYFNSLLIYTASNSSHVVWSLTKITLSNLPLAFILLFLVDDSCYYVYHRLLHWGPLYQHVHKHHHREVSPSRFTDDAYNAHPIEFTVTASFFLVSMRLLQHVLPSLHVLSVLLFASVNATLAAVNHSRIDLDLGEWMYRSKAHDTHHARGKKGGNYAQFLKVLDVVGGSYVEWEAPAKQQD